MPDTTKEQLKEDIYRRFSASGRLYRRVRMVIRWMTWIFVIQFLSGIKRLCDFWFALFLLIMLSPVFSVSILLLLLTGEVFSYTLRIGRWGIPFHQYAFCQESFPGKIIAKLGISRLPVLFNVILGEMSFIGPRAARPEEMSLREKDVRKRCSVRPGIVCLWWIRKRANINYSHEVNTDVEYVESQTIWGDIGIAFRAIPAILYGEGVDAAPDSLAILGIPIDNVTMDTAVEMILKAMSGEKTLQICFVNAHCANIAYRNEEYRQVLSSAYANFADGIGLKLAGKLLRREIRQNVNGTDLFPILCKAMENTPNSIYLLGGTPGISEAVAAWIQEHYPSLRIAGHNDGYFTPADEARLVLRIAESKATLLLVAMGVPRQDIWIRQHLDNLGVKVAIGVGGLFDFYSGRIPRAPIWMRESGLEWVYRLSQEPGRLWKRYIVGNVVFLYHVFLERITGRSCARK